MNSNHTTYVIQVYNIVGPSQIVNGDFVYTKFPMESVELHHEKATTLRDKLDIGIKLASLLVQLYALLTK